jgi:pimeloyl-ACP methyl ester carboxylesterase
VVARLEAAGVKTVAVDNPSVARAPADLHADADNVMRVLDAVRGPVTLVGHSYGGAVITDAGVHDRVERLVYLTAFALDIGESVMVNDLKGGEETQLGDAIVFDGDLAIVRAERATELFFHDCDPPVAADAVARLEPMSVPALAGIPRSIAWRRKPSSYIMCTDDRILPVELQQSNAARTDETFEMPTSHSPFLSRPDALAELLIELSAR